MVGKKDGVSLEAGPGPALTDRWEAGAYLARWREAELADELLLKSAYDDVLNRAQHSLGDVTPERIRELYGKKLHLSASQIDRQAECRLSYFLRYGLRAQELKEVTVDPAEFGTFVHAVLEETVKEIMGLGGFHQVSAEETLDIAHRHAEGYARERFKELDSERLSYLFMRNGLELDMVVRELWEELSRSEFEPIRAEVRFGDGGEMQAVPIRGKRMDAELMGAVDRVDMWFDGVRRLIRVVDYKTGKKDFDYCDVFNGVGLQMLLYLFALEQEGAELVGGRPTVAGVQYFPARFPYLSKDGRLTEEEAQAEHVKNAKRRGLILSDEDVLEAMEPGGEFTRLSCKRSKSGELKGDVADSAQLRQLREYVFRTLAEAVDSIAGAAWMPTPTPGAAAIRPAPSVPTAASARRIGRRDAAIIKP